MSPCVSDTGGTINDLGPIITVYASSDPVGHRHLEESYESCEGHILSLTSHPLSCCSLFLSTLQMVKPTSTHFPLAVHLFTHQHIAPCARHYYEALKTHQLLLDYTSGTGGGQIINQWTGDTSIRDVRTMKKNCGKELGEATGLRPSVGQPGNTSVKRLHLSRDMTTGRASMEAFG